MELGTHIISIDGDGVKTVKSDNYNCRFNLCSGYMERWGGTEADDCTPPVLEVIDFEVTTRCSGVNGVPCSFCYKANSPNGKDMSFETFKEIFDKLPQTLTQIAFSADSTLKSNPDLFKMMRYCWDNPKNLVIPSISVAQLAKEEAVKLIEAGVGCVGVSLYDDKEVCYDTIKTLIDAGRELDYPIQVNIQAVVAETTFDKIMEVLDDMPADPRLCGLHCIVYLAIKQKGRGKGFGTLPVEKWVEILAKTSKVTPFYGVDVCSTKKLLAYEGETEENKSIIEPCEAGYYSAYVNVSGRMYPCSFLEGVGDWVTGESLLEKTFDDIWGGDRFKAHRVALEEVRCLSCKKSCVYWEI